MTDSAILIKPTLRATVSSLSAAVRSITSMSGFIYGVTYGAGTTQLAKVALFGSTANQTLSIPMTNVQDITNDGSYLYAVEERGSVAGASNNQILMITPVGSCTSLTASTYNMRSVVYDDVFKCLYVSCPFDFSIRRVSGGGIGGDTSAFTVSDFITGITNEPGRLWLDTGSTKLYFTTELNEKQVGVVSLSSGVPGDPSYYSLLAGVGETTNFIYLEELDTFIYSGPNALTGHIFSLGSFGGTTSALTASTRFSQATVFGNSDFAYSDGTNIRYADITTFS